MTFYGTPNMGVFELNKNRRERKNPYKRRKLVFRFDENGEFTTNDPALMTRLSKRFIHNDESNPVKVEDKEEKVEVKLRKCKKCDFTCENQGELLAHYRNAHPKSKEG